MQLRFTPHRRMLHSQTLVLRHGRTARDEFISNWDLLHATLNLLPLVPLMKFGQTMQWARKEVVYMIRQRIIRYTLPFFAGADEHHRFFQNLEESRSWVVGPVALAALSFSCDPDGPHIMTVLSPSFALSTWRDFMTTELGFNTEHVRVPTGYYRGIARCIIDFSHSNNPVWPIILYHHWAVN
jgi:hypothetical protein